MGWQADHVHKFFVHPSMMPDSLCDAPNDNAAYKDKDA